MSTLMSQRLKLELLERNIKPIELARISNINKANISKYLSGKNQATGTTLLKLGEALNINAMWLVDEHAPKHIIKEELKNDIHGIREEYIVCAKKLIELGLSPEDIKNLAEILSKRIK